MSGNEPHDRMFRGPLMVDDEMYLLKDADLLKDAGLLNEEDARRFWELAVDSDPSTLRLVCARCGSARFGWRHLCWLRRLWLRVTGRRRIVQMYPERWSKEELQRARERMGNLSFAPEYNQKPPPRDEAADSREALNNKAVLEKEIARWKAKWTKL